MWKQSQVSDPHEEIRTHHLWALRAPAGMPPEAQAVRSACVRCVDDLAVFVECVGIPVHVPLVVDLPGTLPAGYRTNPAGGASPSDTQAEPVPPTDSTGYSPLLQMSSFRSNEEHPESATTAAALAKAAATSPAVFDHPSRSFGPCLSTAAVPGGSRGMRWRCCTSSARGCGRTPRVSWLVE